MKTLSALCLALLLAACGGSSSTSPGIPLPPVNPPGSVNDSFFTRVLQLIGMSPDDEDGAPVEGVIVTTPEDTEPVAVS